MQGDVRQSGAARAAAYDVIVAGAGAGGMTAAAVAASFGLKVLVVEKTEYVGGTTGPGITLGPALTFGYIAARHLAEARGAASLD